MYYSGWVRQRPFWDYPDQPREKYEVWIGQIAKDQGQKYVTNQQLPL